ncbi:MAG: magnesium and cobalt transport protein CorA [Bacteroidetes bacterium]|nr:MAG: magnesium and cobalt transport protein CorA [Bacteroidota bacterium]TAE70074.1 MAG: magnesium and cobalt transport protein CorA [Bacteroidota bacterium]TAF93403.1 MAG: magnesium and cobalt transport protein CorA [Bacteroidota bacterium]
MFPTKYLQAIFPVFNTTRTKDILHVNPTVVPARLEAKEVVIDIIQYNSTDVKFHTLTTVTECAMHVQEGYVTWINIDGLRKADVETVSKLFNIHYLVIEDILSVNQRPKVDDFDHHLVCLLNMLYFNTPKRSVEQEQISIILGKNYVITFQEDASRDVFDSLRDRLKLNNHKLRISGADYLCYALLDTIVDHYFLVMENLSEVIETVEEEVIRYGNTKSLARINSLRKELIVLKRNVAPVKDLVSGVLRSESDLLEERNTKYFKDVYDHIVQANDMVENYRDVMMGMQDLYMNKANLRMNEVMKVMTIVTCLLAPATVIGGIFGMNFDRIPYLHHEYGFFIAVSLMLLIPIWMIWIFKRRGWF